MVAGNYVFRGTHINTDVIATDVIEAMARGEQTGARVVATRTTRRSVIFDRLAVAVLK